MFEQKLVGIQFVWKSDRYEIEFVITQAILVIHLNGSVHTVFTRTVRIKNKENKRCIASQHRSVHNAERRTTQARGLFQANRVRIPNVKLPFDNDRLIGTPHRFFGKVDTVKVIALVELLVPVLKLFLRPWISCGERDEVPVRVEDRHNNAPREFLVEPSGAVAELKLSNYVFR